MTGLLFIWEWEQMTSAEQYIPTIEKIPTDLVLYGVYLHSVF